MNIGQAVRSLFGELRTGEARSLALKPGQIVRGVVGNVGADRQATVMINGVAVQALLEVGLSAGDAAWLQVQPPGADGAIRLKLAQTASELPQGAAPAQTDGKLAGLGLSATKGNQQALALLEELGLPVTKTGVQEAALALQSPPTGVGKGEWQAAVRLALAKGLPLSRETLASLASLTSGPSPDETLATLGQQIRAALAEEGGAAKNAAPLRQLGELLTRLAEAVQQGARGDAAAAGTARAAADLGAGRAASPAGAATPDGAHAGVQAETAPAANPAAAASRPAASAAAGAGAAQAPGDAAPSALPESAAAAGRLAPERTAGPPLAAAGLGETAADAAASPQAGRADWLSQLLTELGVEHEAKLAERSEQLGGLRAEGPHAKGGETLKELLLQVSRQEDLPPALKESASRALLQVTGQQLLLAGDRTQPLAHLTVMVPFYNEQGQQTAAVHIESRRGSRGELDADNCRLLFDLSMRTLGPMIVDVQVTDRAVGIRLLNGQGKPNGIFESARGELSAMLESTGYRLAFLTTGEYPTFRPSGEETAATDGWADVGLRERLDYHSRPYKSMDVRI
ncbi:hypothetical protein [Gorillibacterium sp. CAU 1737]|uniref:hypothetical protein n=1 Tax=Gorillibacterium sp. CAU 1737 TaxID=3140362 RepID=UPI003260F207